MFKKKTSLSDLAVVERQIHNLTKLVHINSMINSTLDMGKLLTVIMETIKEIMDTEASTLLLYDESAGELVFKVALGEAGKELTERYRLKVGQGIAGWVAENLKPIYINDVYGDRRFDPEFDRITGFVTKSIICTPLLYKGKLLGVIQAINPNNRPAFTDDDMKLFEVFADQAALAVQNAIFFQNALEEERIKSELSAARALQAALIPPIDMDEGDYHISARSSTAREIGGEFHCIMRLGEERIAIALGDLHEKGVPGGMHASIVSGALMAIASIRGGNPVELVRMLRNVMDQRELGIANASLLYAVLDTAGRSLHFINAGIIYPVLVRDGVARYLRFGARSLEQNLAESKIVTVSLRPGDLFVVMTDGIMRVKNRIGRQLGLKSVMKCLEEIAQSEADLIESLMRHAAEFAGEVGIREDVSIIAIRVKA